MHAMHHGVSSTQAWALALAKDDISSLVIKQTVTMHISMPPQEQQPSPAQR